MMLRHGETSYPYALHDLMAVHRGYRGELSFDLLIIDNEEDADFHQTLPNGVEIIGGDNRFWEFSGWERGLRHLGDRLDRYELIHFVTDAFHNDYTYFVNLFTPGILRLAAARNLAVGHIDAYPDYVRINGAISRAWLRTSFFFLTPQAVKNLATLVTVTGEHLFSRDPQDPFKDSSEVISDTYQSYISGWLIGEGQLASADSPYRQQFEATHETFPHFQAKSLAIINEHGLSVRLRGQGIPILDVEWINDLLLAGDLDWSNEDLCGDALIDRMITETQARRAILGIAAP